ARLPPARRRGRAPRRRRVPEPRLSRRAAGDVRQGAQPGAERRPSRPRPHDGRHGLPAAVSAGRERRPPADGGGRRRSAAHRASRDHVPAPLGGRGGRARATPVTTLVTLTTDFGLVDPWVGIMKGGLAPRAREPRVVDVTHGTPPQNVLAGALVLRHAVPYFPPGTIHLAVVDPGVG